MFGIELTSTDVWTLVAIVLLIVALAFLAMAETALNRISKVKAQAMADATGSRSTRALASAGQPARALPQRAARDGDDLPDRAGLPDVDPGRPPVRHGRGDRCFHPQRHRLLRAGRGGAEDLRRAPSRAGRAHQHADHRRARPLPAPAAHLQGADRPHERDPARQGSEAGAVRVGAGAARDRRGRGRGRGHRARGARAHRVHHRVRRHRGPRGHGAAAGHGADPPRRDRQRCARHRHRTRLQPAARDGRGGGRSGRSRSRQGSDAGRAGRARGRTGGRRGPAGPVRPREQAAQPADARDAGREVPPDHRPGRVRRHRRHGHPGGLPGGAGRRDRRRVRPRGPGGRAPARRHLRRRRRDEHRRPERPPRDRAARRGLGHDRRVRVQHARPRAREGGGRRVERLALRGRAARRPPDPARPGLGRTGPAVAEDSRSPGPDDRGARKAPVRGDERAAGAPDDAAATG